ncbi:2887_t:CDS:2 [Diversispora eburnea]|uniref:2887_t:CDS:1 n=1 Tax=Diversispora eburnea TaxID=1213867 RepID=A0A9N8VLB5_9GLOM|nr:2887_t:CDS:2 [Diversispora eburnea]
MKFIEIGANLTDPIFRGFYRGRRVHEDDFSHMLQRTVKAGVEKIIVTAGNVKECNEALELAKNHDNLYSTVGCHPTRCNEFEEDPGGPDKYYQKLVDIVTSESAKDKVVAIGECGLVVHSITCNLEEMERIVSLGLYIGINGCSLKTKENLEVAKRVPEDRLMIETDAPWCDIRPTHASHSYLNLSKEMMDLYRPPTCKKEKFQTGFMVKGRNEPCCIGQVLYILASIRGTDPITLADKIYENTKEN